MLQGGGALGAYQAGVYQALHECGIEPDWVSGVSIGAINAAIIAGNVPDQRLSRLRTFWELITDRKIWPFTPDGDVFRKARNATSSWMTMLGGAARVLRAACSKSVAELAPPGSGIVVHDVHREEAL